jgi:ABC-type Fe3+/spermidine/putrescine transport system ATPase subunit
MEVLTPKLSIRNMNKSFDGKTVLNNLNFDLMEGEFLSILGPSGCGKTTLLRILIGLDRADSGQILKGGKDISNLPSSKRGMGIVFQNYALFPNMTVLQNVEYALTLRKETKKEARNIAMRTLEQVGLMDQIHKYPNQLSGGQQQRVAIARTLATNPDIILLDEPISALDVANREIMKAELKSIQKKFNATMLFITHDQEEAFFLSDRIMVMDEGNVEQLATPLEIYRNPASDYVRSFVVEQLDKKYTDLLHYTGRDAYEE